MPNEVEEVGPIQCGTASEFVEKISKLPDEIRPPDFLNQWVYRGHAVASWRLRPAAWRENSPQKLKSLKDWVGTICDKRGFPPEMTEWMRQSKIQWVTEVEAIRQFCNLADQIGLVIPNADDVPILAISLNINSQPSSLTAYFRSLSGAAAFAQHHGVPTRLLDWTRNPLFAAFFALESIPGKDEEGEPICVWATKRQTSLGVENMEGLTWITVPRGHHPFVHAQDSVFSLSGNGNSFIAQYGRWPSFLETPHMLSSAYLYRWTLPRSETQELRKLLFSKGISRSRLMPTLDNVAKTTMACWDWL